MHALIDGTAAGRAAGRTFAGYVPERTMLRHRAEIAVCGQRFAEYAEPITNEMVIERDAYVVAFLKICRPTHLIVRSGLEVVKAKAAKSQAKVTKKEAV